MSGEVPQIGQNDKSSPKLAAFRRRRQCSCLGGLYSEPSAEENQLFLYQLATTRVAAKTLIQVVGSTNCVTKRQHSKHVRAMMNL